MRYLFLCRVENTMLMQLRNVALPALLIAAIVSVVACVNTTTDTDVDLVTGDVKISKRCFGISVHVTLQENRLSRAIKATLDREGPPARWVHVSQVYSFSAVSPHFINHEVAALIKSLCLASDISNCGDPELARIGFDVLNRISQGDHDGAEVAARLWIADQLGK